VGSARRFQKAGSGRRLRKLLVANRGEIAARVIRAARELGIRTVAVHAEDDASALYVEMADEARLLPGEGPAATYLSSDALCRAALETGADAIHPGYGFLAESADFARAVRDAGLQFIGPSPEAMDLVGAKSAAKGLAERLGIPIVSWISIDGLSETDVVKGARRLGYPLLVKASAGGGGKGMRVVEREGDLLEATQMARAEAQAAFRDGRIFIERRLSEPRHIEVQILGDSSGAVVAFPERECSIQRRHQKLVEESPSVAVDPALRARLQEAAIAIGRGSGYAGAGTIEFLLDANGAFYFLEVNARLQVEHPVTEAVSGIDVVAWQLRIAAGEKLPAEISGLDPRGHAIECRLNAEDPANAFLPAAGRVERFVAPAGPGIRVDSGIRGGEKVSARYDPLLAKIIVAGEDRSAAIRRMRSALRETVLLGIPTNIGFLISLIAHPSFASGDTTTSFLPRFEADLLEPPPLEEADLAALALFEVFHGRRTAGGPAGGPAAADPWATASDFRVGS
jgi:acetyl/propionyl-CoA carboxylase alpha subunit